MVGFAVLTLFYLIPMVCKLCGISETHRIEAAQPTLRLGLTTPVMKAIFGSIS